MKSQLEHRLEPFEPFEMRVTKTPEEAFAVLSDEGTPHFETMDEDGNTEDIDLLNVINEVRKLGHWACIFGQQITLWADWKKVTFDELLFLIGHEIGHILQEQTTYINLKVAAYDTDPEAIDAYMTVENNADIFAFASYESHRLANQLWEKFTELEDLRKVHVCSHCYRASCVQGEFMCDEAVTAGIIEKSIRTLKHLDREDSHYWSEK